MKFIIIGSGPNGIYCASQLIKSFPNSSVVIFEQGESLNNLKKIPEVAWHSTMSDLILPSTLNEVIDLNSRPRTSELVNYYSHFIRENDIKINNNSKAILVGKDTDKPFVDIIESRVVKRYYSDFLIIATGIYENNRIWKLDSNSSLINRTIDLSLRKKNLVLVGGGNSAIDFIIYLLPYNKITWIIKNNNWSPIFSNVKPMFEKIIKNFSNNLKLYLNTEISSIEDDSTIILKNGEKINNFDQISVLIGYNSRNELFTNSDIKFENECIKTNAEQETSINDIYVFGSIAAKWNGVSSTPTFISNGNKNKLDIIIKNIKKKIVERDINNCILRSHPYAKIILIVVHPDDELLWAHELLNEVSDLLVVCLTNKDNDIRRNSFIAVMKLYDCEYEIFNFPDRGVDGFTDDDLFQIEKILTPIINSSSIEKVYTHNPDGDYGHPSHAAVSFLIEKNIIDKSKLFFFTFGSSRKQISKKDIKALEIYFPKFKISNFPTNFLKSIVELFIQFKSIIRLRKFDLSEVISHFKYGKSISNFKNDLEHIEAMHYSEFVNYYLYKRPFDTLSKLYNHWKVPGSGKDLYIKFTSFYDMYIDRKYIITEFLPSCAGLTLSVGCHSYNRYDAYCMKEPNNFVTIDLNPSFRVFGSPYEHFVGDFLAHSRTDNRLYQNIILFGVLGIPSTGFNDNYTLFNLEELAISHADKILNPGGLLLIGPDISLNKEITREVAIKYWFDIAERVELLNTSYILQYSLIAKTNLILIFKKKSNNG
jgi:thioredoxin reductase